MASKKTAREIRIIKPSMIHGDLNETPTLEELKEKIDFKDTREAVLANSEVIKSVEELERMYNMPSKEPLEIVFMPQMQGGR